MLLQREQQANCRAIGAGRLEGRYRGGYCTRCKVPDRFLADCLSFFEVELFIRLSYVRYMCRDSNKSSDVVAVARRKAEELVNIRANVQRKRITPNAVYLRQIWSELPAAVRQVRSHGQKRYVCTLLCECACGIHSCTWRRGVLGSAKMRRRSQRMNRLLNIASDQVGRRARDL